MIYILYLKPNMPFVSLMFAGEFEVHFLATSQVDKAAAKAAAREASKLRAKARGVWETRGLGHL